jgi:aryl-alcohol dehydrogenase-like predicted oxidoreductase
MRYRKLGRTGFEIGDIGYGAWGIGGRQWLGGDDEEALRALRTAIDLGLNFIDTALAYGDGHSERLAGNAVRAAGRRVYVATKAPPKNGWPVPPGADLSQVYPHEYVVESVERSLQNLGLDAIDVFQLHVWNAEWTAREEWRRTAEDLKRSGKIRAFGISVKRHHPETALEAVATGLVDTVQVLYNVFDQSAEARLFPLCRERNVGVIARVPLDEGALTGAIGESTVFEPSEFRSSYFRGDRKKQVAERVAALQSDLAGVEGTLPEIALRFTLSHPAVSTSIPGMRRAEHARANCAASDKGPLDPAVLAILRRHVWDRNFYE